MGGLPHFAVLQKESAGPTAEQLKRVFSSFIHLTDADAVRLATSTRGILMRQLNRDSARAFQSALAAEGVGTAVVAEDELPRLPDAKSLRRMEISPEAFVAYDLLGRPTPIEWNRIALVAAGGVRRFEFTTVQTERTVLSFNPISGVWPKKISEIGHKTEWDSTPVLEIVLADGSARYQIEATGFPFKYVIDRPELSVPEKFLWLVREICRHTPHAMLSEGTRIVRDGQDVVLEYNTRQMLVDEMVWLLWSQSQPPPTDVPQP